MKIKVSNVNTPNWKEVTVKSRIPAELEKLSEISRNIWWAWNFEATELFRDLDPELWKECGQNPVLLLERMSYEKLEALAKDKVILRRMNDVYTKFRDYLDVKPDENPMPASAAFPGAVDAPVFIGEGEAQYLTTEVGGCFTGNYIGLYASKGEALFTEFSYQGGRS